MTAAAPPAVIQFFVRGRPVPKGSVIVRHIHGQRLDLKHCNCRNFAVPVADAKLDEWTRLLATAAARAMGQRMPFAGPVRVTLTFYYERPKYHAKLASPPRYVIAKGRNDSDKLARACLDAFTSAACWGDDSQAMLGGVMKVYCDGDERPGVVVTLEEIS